MHMTLLLQKDEEGLLNIGSSGIKGGEFITSLLASPPSRSEQCSLPLTEEVLPKIAGISISTEMEMKYNNQLEKKKTINSKRLPRIVCGVIGDILYAANYKMDEEGRY